MLLKHHILKALLNQSMMMMVSTNINHNNKYKFNNLHYDPTNLAFLDPLANFKKNYTTHRLGLESNKRCSHGRHDVVFV
jgi:hypothetical protein